MIRLRAAAVASGALALVIAGVLACGDVTGGSTSVLSIQFDSLSAPSVVVGDTLRDTTGAVILPVVHAFNFKGDEILPAPVWFQSPDSGVSVDSLTGILFADSLRSTPARLIATVGNLQAIQSVNVTLRPDLFAAEHGFDSLSYSLVDTTLNVSPQLTVKLTHGVAPNDSAVKSYIVSFAIVYAEQSTAWPARERCRKAICRRYDRRQWHSGKSDSAASSLPRFRDRGRFHNCERDREVPRRPGERQSGATRSESEAAQLDQEL